MANMIDLESKRKIPQYSIFEKRNLNVLELMEGIFGLDSNNSLIIEPSIINENWPCFNIISDVNFGVNSPSSPVSCLVSM